ncbi:hypothetical protein CDN99_06960 [Roseateles aquatilis]|uniref:CAAX prenyl protease 2/Lysostaphin resistance protein A-like domain-containing protein n=1 Tax=Roseateles aquatilis TaxID=431061 RepID=A0A246JHH4_9BURK|nr:CPBP family intramembrane glutamic endopeptidase [Roseateles aquatilis]OWQ92087.1 hypothetical protein CDN99_06960 [Roseateles aquatilis]
MRKSNLSVASAGVLLEPIFLLIASYALIGWLFSLHWRLWVDDAAASIALPFLAVLLVLLCAIALSRHRYALAGPVGIEEQRSRVAGRRLATVLLVSLPIAFLAGTSRFSDRHAFELMVPLSLAASILPILAAATLEEFIGRRVLISRLTRLGVPMLLAVVLQALVFVLLHGKSAASTPGPFAWYFTAGLTLGTLYVATRSLWPSVALHFMMNLCLAQTRPTWNWYTQRAVEEISADWVEPLPAVWLTAIVVYWAWRSQRHARPTRDSPGG